MRINKEIIKEKYEAPIVVCEEYATGTQNQSGVMIKNGKPVGNGCYGGSSNPDDGGDNCKTSANALDPAQELVVY